MATRHRWSKFEDLREGQVFRFVDGRVSEAETWLPFVKTGPNEAVLLVVSGRETQRFVDNDCLGYACSTNVEMDSSQYRDRQEDVISKP